MKEDRPLRGNQTEKMQVAMIIDAVLAGVAGGMVALIYRVALNYADNWLDLVLGYIKGNPLRTAGWFLILMLLAVITGQLVKWEPMIAGGGIPQVKKEISGPLARHWKRVLPAKTVGGFLCILGGLSLGRCGPSVQLGAMAGQGVSQILGRGEEEERCLMTCGAGAGMAATFHAPLAGMMFAMEVVNKRGNIPLFISTLAAATVSDYCASCMIGRNTIFHVNVEHILPQTQYWLLLLMGILMGTAGVFYNQAMRKIQNVYKKPGFLNETGRLMTAFLTAGIMGLLMPSMLGGGSRLILSLTKGDMLTGMVISALVIKFLFSGICFGSGAPGGNVFPILTLGALCGGIFAMAGVEIMGLDPVYFNNFVLLAMAGFFSAALRAPVTGTILLFEMSGAVNQLSSLSVVCLMAYVTAELAENAPSLYRSWVVQRSVRHGTDSNGYQ